MNFTPRPLCVQHATRASRLFFGVFRGVHRGCLTPGEEDITKYCSSLCAGGRASCVWESQPRAAGGVPCLSRYPSPGAADAHCSAPGWGDALVNACYDLSYAAAACGAGAPPSCVAYCTGACGGARSPAFALSATAIALLVPVPKWVAPEQFGMHASMAHGVLLPVATSVYALGALTRAYAPVVVAGDAAAVAATVVVAARAWRRHGLWVGVHVVPRAAVIASLLVVLGLGVSGDLVSGVQAMANAGWRSLPCLYTCLAASVVWGIACAAHHKLH